MSRTETNGLKPPRKAAGVIAISMVPSCAPSIIWRPPPSCDDGKILISTSPFVRSLISSAAFRSPRCFAVVGGSCEASFASNFAALAAETRAMHRNGGNRREFPLPAHSELLTLPIDFRRRPIEDAQAGPAEMTA